jgi:hypothetical protein
MKRSESARISWRRLLAIAGVSTGFTLLARSPLFANGDGILPTTGDGTRLKKASFGASLESKRRAVLLIGGSA